VRLTELNLVIRKGTNNPTYSVNYEVLLKTKIADKLLEDEKRPISGFNHGFIEWLYAITQTELEALFSDYMVSLGTDTPPVKMSSKELEYLTIELS